MQQFRIWIFPAAENADFADLTQIFLKIRLYISVKSAKSAYSAANNYHMRNC
jgi:hypothetical protein